MPSNSEKVRLIFGLKLKQLRQDKGIPLNVLADRAGFSVSYLNEIEKGKKYPKSDKIFALAKALDTDYDTLVSMKLGKKLEPITELLNSNILQELPLELFGIDLSNLLELLSDAPAKVSSFIHTIIEISRSYGMNVEQFYFSALRSYQELHDNYFPDIEAAADGF
ncbi:MAG: helix-turn-helix transcriptional regulator, partial [Cytophagales bacterium]|nr:helix-turn-helix transcriptional regulator [Cytophagales bacterium]